MNGSAALVGLLVSFAAPALLCAKGDTVLIEIQGGSLAAPIRATDPVIEQFNVWDGPGANGAVLENATGFIIDWHAGIVAQHPQGLEHYEVSFYAGCRAGSNEPGCADEKPHLAYVVSYDWIGWTGLRLPAWLQRPKVATERHARSTAAWRVTGSARVLPGTVSRSL